MKTLMSLIIVFVLLTGCGSGGGNGGTKLPVIPPDSIKAGDVLIDTHFYDIPAGVASVSLRGTQGVLNSVFSAMVATDPIRMPTFSQGDNLIVNTTFFNNTPGWLLDLQYSINIEHPAYLVREYWMCYQCYTHNSGDGSSCNGLWQEQGGFFYNTTTPLLEVCDVTTPPSVSGFCVDTFPPYIDCGQTPYYKIDYNAPSNGCFKGEGVIPSIKTGESFTASIGVGGGFNIRADYLASAFINTTKGLTVAEKYYIFDVNP